MWLDPLHAPGVLFCDVGCQNRLPATRVEQNSGRAKVFTGSINRMEVPLYRERNPGPQETGQITGLSSAPRTCFDCNVLCFLLVFFTPSFHGSPRCQLSWTAQKQCCAVVVWALSCDVGVLLLKFNLYTPAPPPLTLPPPTHHTHIHLAYVIITVVAPQLAHIHTPLTWQELWINPLIGQRPAIEYGSWIVHVIDCDVLTFLLSPLKHWPKLNFLHCCVQT